jgi:hypothetical protein
MATESHAGKITLHRVPRSIMVAMLVAVLSFVVHMLGGGEKLVGVDLAVYVDRVLEGLVMLSTYFGWSGLASALKDPAKSVID